MKEERRTRFADPLTTAQSGWYSAHVMAVRPTERMDEPLLRTKLYIPITRPDRATKLRTSLIPRPRLIEQPNEGLPRRLTLISAPAGFGKTTLVSGWLEQTHLTAAWLSLDKEDNDYAPFWTYFIAALQTIWPETGTGVLVLLHSSPLPPSHTLLTRLLNDLTAVPEKLILVLDDYHTSTILLMTFSSRSRVCSIW